MNVEKSNLHKYIVSDYSVFVQQYLAELSLVDCDPFLKYLPSQMAAACFTLANNTVTGGSWVGQKYCEIGKLAF